MNALQAAECQESRLSSPVYLHPNLSSLLFSVNMLSITTPEEYLSPLSCVNSGGGPHNPGVCQPWRPTHPEVGIEVVETVVAEAETPVVQKFAKVMFRADLNSPYRSALY